MRTSRIAAGVLAAASFGAMPPNAASQHLSEVRVADTKYRFADWSHTWTNGAVVDVFYVGVPGSNELNAGGGYATRLGALTLTPLVYAVVGKEAGQRGVKFALLSAVDSHGWKLIAFIGAYSRVAGDVRPYQVLDTLDVTRTIGRRWEAGVQAGFFHADRAWNTQAGPLLKLTDRFGAWALSYRFGDEDELRFGRVFVF